MKIELKHDKDEICKCGCRYGKHLHPGKDNTWCWGEDGQGECECIKFVKLQKEVKK